MRPLCLFLVALSFVRADPPPEVTDLIARAAGALSDSNVPAFMKGIDKAMPDYGKIETQVTALLDQATVGSSVTVRSDKGDDHKRDLELDWFLEIKSREPEGPLVRRHEIIQCEVARRDGKWKIAKIAPLSFFAPLVGP